MARARQTIGITYNDLYNDVFQALKELGGSGTISEINDKVIEMRMFDEKITDVPHDENGSRTELEYQLAWARTYLKKYGAIDISDRGVWAITKDFQNVDKIDNNSVKRSFTQKQSEKSASNKFEKITNSEPEESPELPKWKTELSDVLHNMNPYGFEKLAMYLLRECGFSDVKVTKKSGDGGIDGTGKLKINGIFSFNVAFQCKRYKGSVGADVIRDFRGSLSTDIEKGVLITTGVFTKSARDEASDAGKKQIDLIDGDEFMNKLAEYCIGLKEIKSYEIDKDYFDNLK